MLWVALVYLCGLAIRILYTLRIQRPETILYADMQLYIDRWYAFRRGPMSNASMDAIIDTQGAEITGAKAVQPFAVAKDSPNRQLAFRLLDFLRANRARFVEAGFRWRDDAPVQSADIQVPPWLKSGYQP